MTRIIAAVAILSLADRAWGQFEILTIERSVETTHPVDGVTRAAGAAVEPRQIQLGDATRPNGYQDIWYRPDNIIAAASASVPSLAVGSSESVGAVTFQVAEPIDGRIICVDSGTGIAQLTGPGLLLECVSPFAVHLRVPFEVGSVYRIDVSAAADVNRRSGTGFLNLSVAPEPSTIILAAAAIILLFLAALRRRRTALAR